MKVLTKVLIEEESFERINDQNSPRQLYRLNQNHQYALALFDGRDRIFQIESEVLTEILNDLGGGVRDVTLVEFKEPEFGTVPNRHEFEIRLYLECDEVIAITQNDDVFYYSKADYKGYIADLSVVPAREIWDLPDEHPFDFLEISQGLKKRLAPFIDKAGPAEVISRMWFDYEKLVLSKNGAVNDGYLTFVEGEFIDFSVVETADERYYLQHV